MQNNKKIKFKFANIKTTQNVNMQNINQDINSKTETHQTINYRLAKHKICKIIFAQNLSRIAGHKT